MFNFFTNLDTGLWIKCGFLAFVPIVLWLYFFRQHLPKKKLYVLITFLAGMTSVLPVKLYEKYWDQTVLTLEHVNLFKHLSTLLDLQNGGAFFSYVLATVVVLLGIFLFVALLMGFLEICSGDNSWTVFRRKIGKIIESPFFFISLGVMCGVVAFLSTLSLSEKVWMFMMVGILEEFVKHLVLRFSDEEKIHSVAEAIQFSIVVALGFAFVENVLYFQSMSTLSLLSTQELAMLIGLRSVISVGAHVSFSAILGYFYGVAKFSNEIYQKEVLENQHPITEWLHRILHLKGTVLFHEQKMMEGVILAMLLHGIFNSLLEFGYLMIVFPYLLGLLFLVWWLLEQQESLQRGGALVRYRTLE